MRRLSLLLLALLAASLTACGVNPVTGKKEIQFISEAQELQMGAQYYGPTRQSEGGDFEVLPELTQYVNEVGQKLAAVADRKLPYEFVVLNNSVPNAWALPGGKIAVNRRTRPNSLPCSAMRSSTPPPATARKPRSAARCCKPD
jgi:predicted Zn-dependent protease